MTQATHPAEALEKGVRLRRGHLGGLTLDVALLVVALLSVATLFAAEDWLPDMLSFFRPQMFYGSVLVLLAALMLRRWARAVLAALLMAFNAWPLMVRAVPLPAQAPAEAVTIRVMSANLLHDNTRTDLVRGAVDAIAPDVLVVQEMRHDWAPTIGSLTQFPYRASRLLPVIDDVDIVSRFPLSEVRRVGRRPGLDVGGGVAWRARVDPSPSGRPFILYAIHPPTPRSRLGWEERARYLDEIAKLIRAEPVGTPVMVVGDWNTPAWSPLLGRFAEAAHVAPTDALPWPAATRIFAVLGLPLPHWLGTPIDRLAVSPQIAMADFRVGPFIGSDHLPVFADLAVP